MAKNFFDDRCIGFSELTPHINWELEMRYNPVNNHVTNYDETHLLSYKGNFKRNIYFSWIVYAISHIILEF